MRFGFSLDQSGRRDMILGVDHWLSFAGKRVKYTEQLYLPSSVPLKNTMVMSPSGRACRNDAWLLWAGGGR